MLVSAGLSLLGTPGAPRSLPEHPGPAGQPAQNLGGSYQRFTDCYKRLYQLQPEMTQRIYDKFITQLQTSVQEEISEIKAEGNLEAVLNTLDRIVEEGKDHTELAWRPSGIPEEDVRSAMVPYFLQQRDALQRRVHRQEAENRQLAEAVLAGRRRVEELQQQGQAQQQAWQALRREQKELGTTQSIKGADGERQAS
uniref:Polyamine-modulated factor 1-like n=1 Tax=Canis lupus dingo TaxID=286419 RepID=A0A8C0K150_CANLU